MGRTLDLETTLSPGTVKPLPRPSPINSRTLWWIGAGLAVVWALTQSGLSEGNLVNAGGWTLVASFLRASIHPALSPDFLQLTLDAALTTLAYAVCGAALSLVIGLIGGVLASEVWWSAVVRSKAYKAPWVGVRAVLSVPRAIHEVIWGLFFINVLGLNPLVAILAIAIPFGAITAKVFSEVFDETPRGPFNALLNSGVAPLPAFLYGLFPQALPGLLSYAFYRVECSIRSAAVLGVIGAGGLGYQILLSFQTLRYNEMWTLIYALIILSGVVDFWSSSLRRRLGAASRIALTMKNTQTCAPPLRTVRRPRRSRVVTLSFVAAGLMIPLSFAYVHADFGSLFTPRSTRLFAQLVHDLFPPALNAPLLAELSRLTIQTLALSIVAIAIAGVGGLLLSFPAANNFFLPGGILDSGRRDPLRRIWSTGILVVTRLALLVARAVPPNVWALLFLFVLFPGVLPGALALGLYTLGVLGRLMAEVVEELDDRPLRALKTLGASGPQVFTYGVLPRAMPGFTGYLLYRWEVATRETIVVGVVGAAGLGRILMEQLSNFDYASVMTTLLFFVGLTFFVDLIGAAARRALR